MRSFSLVGILYLVLLTSPGFGQRDSLMKIIRTVTVDTLRIQAMRELAYEYLQSHPDSSLQLADKINTASTRLPYPAGIAMAYDIRGNVLRTRGEFIQALTSHKAAMRIFDSLRDTRRYRSSLVNAGTDYFYLKNYNRSLDYFNRALALTSSAEVSQYVTILNNLGNVYSTIGRYPDAIRVYEQALPLARKDSTYTMQSSLYASIAIAYAESGQLHRAVNAMLEAIQFQKACNDLYHFASSASTLAGFYIELEKYNEAERYLNEALSVAVQLDACSIIANYYRNKAHLYNKTKRYQAAYEMLQQYTLLNDSLLTESHVAQLAEAEVKFNMEMQSRQLAMATAAKSLQESELRQQTLWKYFLLILLIAILGLLLLAYRNMRLRQKVNLRLEEQNAMLHKENMLAQYETLRNQVNPHFLFNSLNALSSLISKDPAGALEFTSVFSRLYRTVLEFSGDAVIPVKDELKLVDDYVYLQRIRFGNNLIIKRNIPVSVMDRLIPPFCIQMLLENAIKHNMISDEHPLIIKLFIEEDYFVVENTLQPRSQTESTGVGIRNITERFRIIHDKVPLFYITEHTYVAKIPLINPEP